MSQVKTKKGNTGQLTFCRFNPVVLIISSILFVLVLFHSVLNNVEDANSFSATELTNNLIHQSLRISQFRITNTLTTNHSVVSISDSQTNVIKNAVAYVTKSKKRIAFIITITKDGFFQDGAAVLVYSIIKNTQFSDFEKSFIAFVHPNVTSSRSGLNKLGFHVIEVPIPINVSAIKFDFLREKINKNGCCGSSELIKLTSYRLIQYDWVVHLDADTIMLNPIDELFSTNYSLIYTTDPNMASYKGEDKLPVQGGFIIFKPSIEDYSNIIELLMTTEFNNGGGWNNSKVGWFWGGMTIQGILPYYYNRVTIPDRSVKIDRCIYNTMADTEPCSVQTVAELKSAHFTVCQKPWTCIGESWGVGKRLCEDLHK
eukprot:gene11445-15332_t